MSPGPGQGSGIGVDIVYDMGNAAQGVGIALVYDGNWDRALALPLPYNQG